MCEEARLRAELVREEQRERMRKSGSSVNQLAQRFKEPVLEIPQPKEEPIT
jgi:hypothetical protein